MARQKETPRPLFTLKHDFYTSLDNVLQEALNLLQAVDFFNRVGDSGPEVVVAKKMLKERADIFRKTLSAEG